MQDEAIIEDVMALKTLCNELKEDSNKLETKEKVVTEMERILINLIGMDLQKEETFYERTLELLNDLNQDFHLSDYHSNSSYTLLLLSFARASICQKFWNLEKMKSALKKTINIAENGFLHLRVKSPLETDDIKLNSSIIEELNMTLIVVELKLQLIAVYSQLEEHSAGIILADEALEQLIKASNILQIILSAIKVIGFDKIIDCPLQNKETIEAHLNCIKATVKVHEFSLFPLSSALPWKTANENTRKAILHRTELFIQEMGLSVNKIEPNEMIQTFHISTVVKIQPLTEIIRRLKCVNLDTEMIDRVVLLTCCCRFSKAAESRFLSRKQSCKILAKKNNHMNMDSVMDLFLQKDTLFIGSERHHGLAITLLYSIFGESNRLMAHLVNSYIKNYSFINPVIEEEVEENSFISGNIDEYAEEKLTRQRSSIQIPTQPDLMETAEEYCDLKDNKNKFSSKEGELEKIKNLVNELPFYNYDHHRENSLSNKKPSIHKSIFQKSSLKTQNAQISDRSNHKKKGNPLSSLTERRPVHRSRLDKMLHYQSQHFNISNHWNKSPFLHSKEQIHNFKKDKSICSKQLAIPKKNTKVLTQHSPGLHYYKISLSNKKKEKHKIMDDGSNLGKKFSRLITEMNGCVKFERSPAQKRFTKTLSNSPEISLRKKNQYYQYISH